MIHGPLDRTAPLPDGHFETSADYGYGCLVCGVAIPVGRRGPMPVYCRRCAKRLQNLRSRAAPAAVPTADPRSPVRAQRLEARATLLRTAIRNAQAELAGIEQRQAELDQQRRELHRAAMATKRPLAASQLPVEPGPRSPGRET